VSTFIGLSQFDINSAGRTPKAFYSIARRRRAAAPPLAQFVEKANPARVAHQSLAAAICGTLSGYGSDGMISWGALLRGDPWLMDVTPPAYFSIGEVILRHFLRWHNE
jgi:hypothetical protein